MQRTVFPEIVVVVFFVGVTAGLDVFIGFIGEIGELFNHMLLQHPILPPTNAARDRVAAGDCDLYLAFNKLYAPTRVPLVFVLFSVFFSPYKLLDEAAVLYANH